MSAVRVKPELQDWLLIIVLGVIWGGSFFFNAIAVDALHPLLIVLLRVSLAAVILWLVICVKQQAIPRSIKVWGAFLMMGALNNAIPFILIVWGQQHIASGLASVLNATTPLFTVVFAALLLSDERVSTIKIVGVVLGFVGVAIMMSADFDNGFSQSMMGQAMVLAAAISYAFAGIFGRRFKQLGVTPLMTATGQVTGSSVILLPIVLAYPPSRDIANATIMTWASIIGLASICTAFAYLLYFRILSAVGATNLSLVTFVVPVSAILLGGLFLSETISVPQWIGIAIIALGLLVIDGRAFGRQKPTTDA